MQKRYSLLKSFLPWFSAIIVVTAVIIPTVKNIYDLEKRIQEERAALEHQYRNRIQTRETLRYINDIKNKLTDYRKIGIIEGQEIEFITALENIADQNSLKQRFSIQPQEVAKNSRERALTLRTQVQGASDAIIHYLNDIEKLPQYFFIDSISIAAQTSDELTKATSTPILASIQGKIPWFK